MTLENKVQQIPKLYETENIPIEDKIIYEYWELPHVGFYWLIAELDPIEKLAFGYANLNDDINAEWGYIDINELESVGAYKVEEWVARKFGEINKKEKIILL